MRRRIWYLILTLVVVVGAFAATLVTGNKPVLGLDLQGGVSVVLSPIGDYRPRNIDAAVDVIRDRVDSLGVAEPEISRQGNEIVVDLPGVKDRAKAERLVGQTAELRFRSVVGNLPSKGSTPATTTTSTTVAGSETTPTSSTTTSPTTTAAPATTLAGGATTTTTRPPTAEEVAELDAVRSCDINRVLALPKIHVTSRENDEADQCVVLNGRTENGITPRYLLGPAELTGKAVASAKRQFSAGQGYTILMRFTDDGSPKWDELASKYYQQPVAITLDATVLSAPTIQTTEFNGEAQITGSFTPEESSDVAKLIDYGALPVQLEKVNVQNVSPTLGQDQLDAGIAAGLLGLALVAIYMLAFYRMLGLVAISGIALSGLLMYALVAFLGDTIGLALTLAGVVGIIVSLGVTIDSYIVYFERLKDETRAGRTVRSSVDRGFKQSFRTILAADLVSLLGAVVLYLLAIGSVRGFAFFLGLSTLLDLIVSLTFMHPLVSLLARRSELVSMRGFGIGAGLDAPEAVA